MNFATTLRTQAEQVGISQTEISRLLRRSKPVVNQWFTGGTRPTTRDIIRLSALLGLDAKDMIWRLSMEKDWGIDPSELEHFANVYAAAVKLRIARDRAAGGETI